VACDCGASTAASPCAPPCACLHGPRNSPGPRTTNTSPSAANKASSTCYAHRTEDGRRRTEDGGRRTEDRKFFNTELTECTEPNGCRMKLCDLRVLCVK